MEGVLFLHGMARRASAMRRIERAFAAAGFATLNLDYPARRLDLSDLTELIAPEVAGFAARVSRFHIVTHSLGGLLARTLVTVHRPGTLGRVVMLGPPNAGSEVADIFHRLAVYRRIFGPVGAQVTTRQDEALTALLGPVDYPLGIIAGDRTVYFPESWWMLPGPNDGRVTVERTCVPGMSDHITVHATHAMMMWNRQVIGEALHFVRHGRFSEAAPRTVCRP